MGAKYYVERWDAMGLNVLDVVLLVNLVLNGGAN